MNSFDALLVVSFGGPEKREDVLPFLENVLRGKNVHRQRMLEVAEHGHATRFAQHTLSRGIAVRDLRDLP